MLYLVVSVVVVSINSSHCSSASNLRWEVRHQSRSSGDCRRWCTWCPALRAGFRAEPALYSEELLFWLSYRHVDWVRGNLWPHNNLCCFWTLEPPGDRVLITSGGWVLCLSELGCGSSEDSQGITRTVVCCGCHQVIFRRFYISFWCENLQHSGRRAGWIRSCECSFHQCSWSQQSEVFLRKIPEEES